MNYEVLICFFFVCWVFGGVFLLVFFFFGGGGGEVNIYSFLLNSFAIYFSVSYAVMRKTSKQSCVNIVTKLCVNNSLKYILKK